MMDVTAIPEKPEAAQHKEYIDERSSNSEAVGGRPDYYVDPIAEKKIVRKCDLRVVPPLTTLFLLAFLDRTNIGRCPVYVFLFFLMKLCQQTTNIGMKSLTLRCVAL